MCICALLYPLIVALMSTTAAVTNPSPIILAIAVPQVITCSVWLARLQVRQGNYYTSLVDNHWAKWKLGAYVLPFIAVDYGMMFWAFMS
jgi:hypothetical protein